MVSLRNATYESVKMANCILLKNSLLRMHRLMTLTLLIDRSHFIFSVHSIMKITKNVSKKLKGWWDSNCKSPLEAAILPTVRQLQIYWSKNLFRWTLGHRIYRLIFPNFTDRLGWARLCLVHSHAAVVTLGPRSLARFCRSLILSS